MQIRTEEEDEVVEVNEDVTTPHTSSNKRTILQVTRNHPINRRVSPRIYLKFNVTDVTNLDTFLLNSLNKKIS